MSGPIGSGEGTAIYKLISTKSQAPANFTKNIADYRKRYQSTLANSALEDRIKSVVASDTKWDSAGYQAVYDVSQANTPDSKKAQDLYDQAKAAVQKTEGFDLRPAELAEYVAFNMLWAAPGADQIKLRPERIQVLSDFLQNMEDFDTRMDLVRLYEADRNGKLADASLQDAAGSNNIYDDLGLRHFGDVAASLITLKSEGLLTPEAEKSIEDIQSQWKKDKTDYDKEQAEEKAADAKARAEEAADRKKAEAEAKAAQSKVPTVKGKDAPAGTTAGSAPSSIRSLIPEAGPGAAPGSPTKGGAPKTGGSKPVQFPPGVLPPSGGSKG